MNDSDNRIASLLTEMRDMQRESLGLQKEAVSRGRRQVRVWYLVTLILLAVFLYFLFRF